MKSRKVNTKTARWDQRGPEIDCLAVRPRESTQVDVGSGVYIPMPEDMAIETWPPVSKTIFTMSFA